MSPAFLGALTSYIERSGTQHSVGCTVFIHTSSEDPLLSATLLLTPKLVVGVKLAHTVQDAAHPPSKTVAS